MSLIAGPAIEDQLARTRLKTAETTQV